MFVIVREVIVIRNHARIGRAELTLRGLEALDLQIAGGLRVTEPEVGCRQVVEDVGLLDVEQTGIAARDRARFGQCGDRLRKTARANVGTPEQSQRRHSGFRELPFGILQRGDRRQQPGFRFVESAELRQNDRQHDPVGGCRRLAFLGQRCDDDLGGLERSFEVSGCDQTVTRASQAARILLQRD